MPETRSVARVHTQSDTNCSSDLITSAVSIEDIGVELAVAPPKFSF